MKFRAAGQGLKDQMVRAVIAAFCALLAVSCGQQYAETNDDRAYYARDGAFYRVEMKGQGLPMVHDPLSLRRGSVGRNGSPSSAGIIRRSCSRPSSSMPMAVKIGAEL